MWHSRLRTSFPVFLFLVVFIPSAAAAELTRDQRAAAQALIAEFAAPEFEVRQQAVRKLIDMGPDVVPLVKAELARTNDAEVKLRCEMVLQVLGGEAGAGRRLVEKVVREFGPAPPLDAVWYTTSDGEGLAWVVRLGKKVLVCHNGVRGPEYDEGGADRGAIALSADGKHIAYAGKREDKQRIVHDGVEGPEFDEVRDPCFWGGDRLTYAAVKDRSRFIVRDGRVSPAYEAMDSFPHLSPDRRHVWSMAMRGGKAFVVVDGVDGPPHTGLQLDWNPPKPRYLAREGEELWLFEANWPDEHPDKPGTIVERKLKSLGRCPPEGVNVGRYGGMEGACFVDRRDGKKSVVTFNGREIGTYEDTNFVAVSRDGKRFAFSAKRGNRWFAVVDGREGPEWDGVRGMVFSKDGSRLGYVGVRDGRHYPVVDGKEGSAWDEIRGGKFSPDGRHAAYVAKRDGRFHVVLDGRESPDYDREPWVDFTEDGAHCLYSARRDQRGFVVCDGLRGAQYDEANAPRFSDDGKHLVYAARRGGQVLVVVDGIEGPPHAHVRFPTLSGPWSARAVRYYASDGGQMRLVEVDWPKDLDWSNGLKPLEP